MHREENMSERSDSSGKANRSAVSAGRVRRSSCSVFRTSLRGRGPQPLGSARSLQPARLAGFVPSRRRIALVSERPLASFEQARGAVALSASPGSPSANQPDQLRYARQPEVGGFGRLAATSRSVGLVWRVRERVSLASSFARSAQRGLQHGYTRSGSVPNKSLEPTPVINAPLLRIGSGAAQLNRWAS
jgi:hypothetical protein